MLGGGKGPRSRTHRTPATFRTPGKRRRSGAARAVAMAATVRPAKPGAANILVVAGGDTPELSVLEKLPPGARWVPGPGSRGGTQWGPPRAR
jgi:hypothetical protein